MRFFNRLFNRGFNQHLSLSERVKLAYIVSFVLLATFSMLLLFATAKLIEDHIFEKQLMLKIDHYQQQLKQHKSANLPQDITVYPSLDKVPNNLKGYIQNTTPGFYELNLDNELDFHYAIVEQTTEGANRQAQIFIFDVNDIELEEQLELKVGQLILLSFIALLVMFFMIFQLIIKRALTPMYQLIEQVKSRQNQPHKPLNYHYPIDNELGLLNQTLNDYSQRIEHFIRREQEFSAFASHELRTPVTIIKGALALLQLSALDDQQQKPVARITRATTNMEDMLEIFLSLSREHHRVKSEPIELQVLLTQVIENLEDKAIKQNKVFQLTPCDKNCGSARVKVEKIPAELVLTNLLLNAIRHGANGGDQPIIIEQNQSIITITNAVDTTNTLDSQDSNKRNYGIGLLIVKRICQQQNWCYQSDHSDTYYRTTISV